MNPDVFVTVAFVLWAVLSASAMGLLVAHDWRHRPILDDAVERQHPTAEKGA